MKAKFTLFHIRLGQHTKVSPRVKFKIFERFLSIKSYVNTAGNLISHKYFAIILYILNCYMLHDI